MPRLTLALVALLLSSASSSVSALSATRTRRDGSLGKRSLNFANTNRRSAAPSPRSSNAITQRQSSEAAAAAAVGAAAFVNQQAQRHQLALHFDDDATKDIVDGLASGASVLGRTCEPAAVGTRARSCGNVQDDPLDDGDVVELAVFCAPESRICGGQGALCASDVACAGSLQCDMQTSRCATAASLSHGPDEARLIAHAQRQASAAANGKSTTIGSGKTHDRTRPRQACPYEAPLVCMAYDRTGTKLSPRCTSPQRDVRNCGGCSGSFALLSGGESSVLAEGQDCAAIPGALATSCRAGKCFVHACQQGFYLDDETATCVRAPADDDDVDLI